MILLIGTVTVDLPLKISQQLSARYCLVCDFLRGYFVTWYCVPAHYSCVPLKDVPEGGELLAFFINHFCCVAVQDNTIQYAIQYVSPPKKQGDVW